jgi:hypothetical protein
MNKEEIVKEVITILDTSSYIDPAEHLYDGLKQIKREITYATVHDFLWALESSTVIDVDGIVYECANKIKPLLADMIIDEVYKNYRNAFVEGHVHEELDECLSLEEFIEEIKTDPEFSEKWGLKIEERELSREERYVWYKANTHLIPPHFRNQAKEYEDKYVPKKLTTIIYNNEKVEIYE